MQKKFTGPYLAYKQMFQSVNDKAVAQVWTMNDYEN